MLPISPSNNRGFTLLELLVVLVIIGLVAGVVSLSVGGFGEHPVQKTAERLQQQLLLAQQQAVFSNQDLGLQFSQQGYSFWHRDKGVWTASENADLASVDWPEATNTVLEVEQQEANLQRPEQPQVVIYNDGQILPFRLQLRDQDTRLSLSASFGLPPVISSVGGE